MNSRLKNNLILSVLVATAIAGGFIFYLSKNSSPEPEKLKAEVGGALNFEKKDVSLATTLGDFNAPITVYEFSDFECPYCAMFASETFPKIKEKYIDTGKVKWVYKFFPLPFHKDAKKAAEASLCAASQGKFWKYHDLLYENQPDFSKNDLKKYAKDLGLNESGFNYCLKQEFYKKEVENDLEMGRSRGVQGTPTFFIGDRMLVGAQPPEVFEQAIDQYLE